MKRLAALCVSFLVASSAFADVRGEFRPDMPEFEPGYVDCPSHMWAGSVCRRLASTFGYRKGSKAYEASAGLVTDGASIPSWAESLIGHGWEDQFIRAAVLHDYYVRKENAVLSYLVVQRLFYWTLIDSGVPAAKARLMYAAVVVGSPKWSLFYRRKPMKCKLFDGYDCVRNDGNVPVDNVVDYVEPAYGDPEFAAALAQIRLLSENEDVPLEALEQAALGARIVAGIPTPHPATYGDE